MARAGRARSPRWPCDITEFLSRIGYAPTREAPGLTVAYHSACSLQHGQQVTAEPKALLRAPASPWSSRRSRISAAAPPAPTTCCSRRSPAGCASASWATSQATKPDLIAAGNIGCITQLAGDAVPVVHTVELLDWMAGGPRPALRNCGRDRQ